MATSVSTVRTGHWPPTGSSVASWQETLTSNLISSALSKSPQPAVPGRDRGAKYTHLQRRRTLSPRGINHTICTWESGATPAPRHTPSLLLATQGEGWVPEGHQQRTELRAPPKNGDGVYVHLTPKVPGTDPRPQERKEAPAQALSHTRSPHFSGGLLPELRHRQENPPSSSSLHTCPLRLPRLTGPSQPQLYSNGGNWVLRRLTQCPLEAMVLTWVILKTF